MSPMTKRPPPPLALAYHGVADVPLRRDPHGLFVRPRDLERQIHKLKSWGYELVRFGELAAALGGGGGGGLAALTFDDGPADNLDSLAPILRAEGVSATVFVVSRWLGESHPQAPWARILSHDGVRSLHRMGVEIGSHTATHPDLSKLGYADVLAELEDGKRELETVIDAPVEVLAYPYGRASEQTVAAAREVGYRAACRISGEGDWRDALNLPRQDMDNGATLLGLRLKRDNRYEPLMRHRTGQLARGLARAARGAMGR
jgi:peptidoglycan/xylan/chitin deacetylase (PgdA/CDA1 family)